MTEATTSLVSAEMEGVIGRQMSRRVSHPVGESDIRRWAIAVYWPEEAPARFTLDRPDAAPEDFNPFAWSVARTESAAEKAPVDANDPDRTEHVLGVRGPGLRHQLNGGLEAEYRAPIRPGDVITSATTLDGYSERDGSLGRMLFTRTEDLWTNQHDDVVKRTVFTLIRY